MKKESDAYFTIEAAILYPIILSVILLMTYLLLFQYDRCLLEQDIGKATVLSGSKWTLTKEQLNDYMQKKARLLKKPRWKSQVKTSAKD